MSSEFDLIGCIKCGRRTDCICGKTYEDAEERIQELEALVEKSIHILGVKHRLWDDAFKIQDELKTIKEGK